ncbi:MAG: ABC transporter permease [Acidobacteriaceae bacterium]|nr:ABC transporter permease [Acidobacteriaceae bacterium]
MKRLLKRLRALVWRRNLDVDLQDEMAFHLAMKADETGDPMAAQRQFGNLSAIKESCRELWMFTSLESWWFDLRFALRTLGRSPTVTWVAIAALALGIGANTTVFTVVSSALSFEMGVEHVERLVMITPGESVRNDPFWPSFVNFRELRAQLKSIEDLAAYRFRPVNLSDSRTFPERYSCVQMTSSAWNLVSRQALLGRHVTPGDERPDAAPVVVLSHRLWQNRYGADHGIVGKTIRIDEVPRTIVGVMPSGIQFPEDTDLWTPLTLPDIITAQQQGELLLFARLKPDIPLAAARTEVDAVARRLAPPSSKPSSGLVADVRPFLELIGVYAGRRILFAVVIAVAFVLLIVCADVANLLLARATERAREISIRVAIGAGRARIIRQLLIESVLLASAGGCGAFLVAIAGLRWFDRISSQGQRPSWVDFSMNGRAFAYLAAVSICAGILFGLAPAFQLAKVDVNSAMKDGGRGAQGGVRGNRLSALLVVFQMALCVVLLAGAGLLIHSSLNWYSAPLGFNASNIMTMRISLPEIKYPHREERISFYTRLKASLESLPGVQAVSIASALPLGGSMRWLGEVEGAPADARHAPDVGSLIVGPDYFRVLQVPLHRGRFFNALDGVTGPQVAVVNESFAAKFWPGQDALGKRFRRFPQGSNEPWFTVAGVIPDIPQTHNRPLQTSPLVYVPYASDPQGAVYVVTRTTVPPQNLFEAARRTVQALDENLPAQELTSLQSRLDRQRLNVSAFSTLFTVFAAVALLLASVGLYAVICQSISRRIQEIGIRMAVGASRRDILKLVLMQGMRHTVFGLAAGLPLAFGLTRVLRGALVGVSPGDPFTFASVVIVLMLASLLGCAVPAYRAIHVDPLVALRFE